MEIESVQYEIDDEEVQDVEHGCIKDICVRVENTTTFTRGWTITQRFTVVFIRSDEDDPFRWEKTMTAGANGMRDRHVIATREAGDYISEHYGSVDLGELE